MKVIFLQDVPPNAHAGDIREVKNGYARNYLLPRGLATTATAGELRRVEKLRREAQVRRMKEASDWREVASALGEAEVEILVRSGPRGRLYGSVTNTMVAAKLSEMTDRPIDRRGIRFEAPIRQLGDYKVTVHYFEGVEGEITVHVRPEDAAEAARLEAAAREAEAEASGATSERSLLEELQARNAVAEEAAAESNADGEGSGEAEKEG